MSELEPDALIKAIWIVSPREWPFIMQTWANQHASAARAKAIKECMDVCSATAQHTEAHGHNPTAAIWCHDKLKTLLLNP
jgi:hypothetical protein